MASPGGADQHPVTCTAGKPNTSQDHDPQPSTKHHPRREGAAVQH